MFPQFADCILQGFRRFYDIVVPPEVFVPVLIHQVVEYLLPFEGVLVGDAGERAFRPVGHHHFRESGVAGGEQPFFPVAFKADDIPYIVQVSLGPLLLVGHQIGDFLRAEP